MPVEIKVRAQYPPRVSLKPVFALASVFIILLAMSFYLFGGLPTPSRLTALADEQLVDDVEILEELTGEYVVFENGDALIDELALLEDLS